MIEHKGIFSIIGPPGTGKTRYLKNQTEAIIERQPMGMLGGKSPVMICSLTRTAAAEVAGRVNLPRNAVGTLHSHAFQALERPELTEERIADWNSHHPYMKLSIGGKDMDDATVGGADVLGKTDGDEASQSYHVLRAKMEPMSRWPQKVRQFGESWEAWKAKEELADFTDLIERAQNVEPVCQPSVVLADEVQDMSALEWALLKNWGDVAGCLMVVGDPYQSLYTWRGAHPELFTDPDVPEDHRKVLQQSYRVPHRAHAAAMRAADELGGGIEYLPTQAEGSIATTPATFTDGRRICEMAIDSMEAGESIMFQASCGYMAQQIAIALKAKGIPFSNPWRRKQGGWNPMGSAKNSTASRIGAMLKPFDGDEAWPLWCGADAAAWVELLKAKGTLKRGKKGAFLTSCGVDGALGEPVDFLALAGLFEDDALVGLMNAFDMKPDSQKARRHLIEWMRGRLASAKAKPAEYAMRVAANHGAKALVTEPQVYVGTVHSFKGAEADRVVFFPDLSRAGANQWEKGGEGKLSIIRAFYVAMTRTKDKLFIGQARERIPVGYRRLISACLSSAKSEAHVPF